MYVKNPSSDESGSDVSDTTPVPDIVTIEKTHDDDGNPKADPYKVDPTYPKLANNASYNMIVNDQVTNLTNNTVPAGTDRGRDVYGFTFANEYVGGGPVSITKRITGKYANKTQKFPVSVTITDNAAPAGSCISYHIEGGTDTTNNSSPTKLDHVESNKTDYMVVFDDSKKVTISANLADGDSIEITGLYGWYNKDELYTNDAQSGQVDHRKRFTDGLKQGTSCSVVETGFGDYQASAEVKYKEKPTDSTERTDSLSNVDNTSFSFPATIGATGSDITIINTLPDSKPNPTGILIDNLPYIIMVGVPLAVFALMFVSKRRSSTNA